MKLAFKKWVENVQTMAYNGVHTVFEILLGERPLMLSDFWVGGWGGQK
jgi:hypothetical protein